MNEVIEFINKLVDEYKYKPLTDGLSESCREYYKQNIPNYLSIEGNSNQKLYSDKGTLICDGYDRIVIGDYGAYIEFNDNQAIKNNFVVKEGQEYRFQPRYSNVKYYWLTTIDNSDCKIYLQRNTVRYADYIPGKFYISVYEVSLNG